MLNFVVNVGSGHGRGKRVLKKLINYCYNNKLDYTVHITGCQGHASRLARALCENNAKTIIAVGGDGTFHEVMNGIIDPSTTTVGFIPSGRGNDFAAGAGVEMNPIKNLIKILDGKIKYIDYLQVGDKRCLNIAGTGMDVDVLKRVEGKSGKITYLKSLLYCLFHYEPKEIYFDLNGETKKYNCLMIAACNGSQFGGGIKVSPYSKVDDKQLDIIIMQMPENGKILRILTKFKKGKHMDMDITTHFKCESLKIRSDKPMSIQLDGEIYDDIAFDVSVVKGGLKTIDYN